MDNSLTCFASAERSPQSEVLRQHQLIADNKDLVIFLNCAVSMLSVLNLNRQIVFANEKILKKADISDVHAALGKRIGELFVCRHSSEVNGCGTSSHCSACGAIRTMLDCVKTIEAIEECSLTSDQSVTLDLKVHSTCTMVHGEEFIICSLFDIGNEKRRGVMERIFFHDIMNTINGISGIAHVLPMMESEKQSNYLSYLTRLTQSLVDDIQSHRLLAVVEKNEYRATMRQISSLDFVREEMEKYRKLALLEAKEVRLTDDSEDHDFVSDKTLLSCVLDNMIKNAIEAEPAGALIEVDVRIADDGYLRISVHNDTVIQETDQLQMFSPSFSTKSDKRRLGTYAMKLFTEKYLNGTVGFESREGKGTAFTIRLPV